MLFMVACVLCLQYKYTAMCVFAYEKQMFIVFVYVVMSHKHSICMI